MVKELFKKYNSLIETIAKCLYEVELFRPGFTHSGFTGRFCIKRSADFDIFYDEYLKLPITGIHLNPKTFSIDISINPDYPDETLINHLRVQLHPEYLKEAQPHESVQEKNETSKASD